MPVLSHTRTIRLSELGKRIAEKISEAFAYGYYWVIAEVSNHSFYALKEHHYLELIEREQGGISAKMQAVAWRTGAARIKHFETITGQKFKNGLKVCIRVQVDYHPAFGLKLVITDVDASFTLGQLELQRQATLDRLLNECGSFVSKIGEDYITRNNQLPHARVIQRIAILGSNSSAGYEDFMHTLLNNQFNYRFRTYNYFIAVQGEAHAENICKKIEEINQSVIAFDAVVIIRGGGADTDFILFDHFLLCQAVAGLHIPVITGIGHLKNQSLIDLLARTSTNAPTKAAEFIIAHNRHFETALLNEQKSLVIKAQQILQRHIQSVDRSNAKLVRNARAVITHHRDKQQLTLSGIKAASKRLLYHRQASLREVAGKTLHQPQALLKLKKLALQNIAERFSLAPERFLAARKSELANFESACRLMSPESLLKRGFALIYRGNQILTKGIDIVEGEALQIKLQDSDVQVNVTSKTMNDGKEIDL